MQLAPLTRTHYGAALYSLVCLRGLAGCLLVRSLIPYRTVESPKNSMRLKDGVPCAPEWTTGGSWTMFRRRQLSHEVPAQYAAS
ncbi:hypothetical protein BV20DRAFT_972852 [Pilatotrama ljubarskyi]|nr:hypothetical protein BV20DRAFT_972852 [Pilatotrama ljubarskyi]